MIVQVRDRSAVVGCCYYLCLWECCPNEFIDQCSAVARWCHRDPHASVAVDCVCDHAYLPVVQFDVVPSRQGKNIIGCYFIAHPLSELFECDHVLHAAHKITHFP